MHPHTLGSSFIPQATFGLVEGGGQEGKGDLVSEQFLLTSQE